MKSISIVIPAYNEEKNLPHAVQDADKVIKKMFEDYELLIINDGSKDRTGIIADRLAERNKRVKVIHLKKNMGFGYAYRQGVHNAAKKYVMMVPGDNEILRSSVKDILSHAGEADIITSYIANQEVRSLIRRLISKLYTKTFNILFGFHLKYYNGMVLYKSSLVKKVQMTTDSFAFQAEILVRLLKNGYSYKEVPMHIKSHDKARKTKAFRIKNIIGIISSALRLFFEVNFKPTKSK